MPIRFGDEEFNNLKKLLPIYEWGQRILLTKLNIIHEDLIKFRDNGAIEYIHGRIKAPESIAEKLHKMKIEITAENARKYLRDIAGVRIICPFARDIYFLASLIRTMPDVKILEERDFISKPKASGYRSYHIIIEVPVYFSGKTQSVPIEIQIRTEAMNFWATLEHKARYKYRELVPQHLSDEMVSIAAKIAELDNRMFIIHESIKKANQEN